MGMNILRNFMVSAALVLPAISLNVQSALADQRDFTVINNNDLVVEQLYVSSANSKSWGRNLLGSNILESQELFDVQFNNRSNQCSYDIKAVYEDGSYDQIQEDLCSTGSVEFYGNGGDYQPTTAAELN